MGDKKGIRTGTYGKARLGRILLQKGRGIIVLARVNVLKKAHVGNDDSLRELLGNPWDLNHKSR